MNVNRVTEQVNYRKTANVTNANGKQKTKQAPGGDFYESLSGSLYGQSAWQRENDTVGSSKIVNTSYQYHSVTSSIKVQQNGVVNACAVVECGARNISYAESDYVKTYVEKGFAFKAKVDITAHHIYIEQKFDDGTVKGYEVDYGKLNENSQDPIEQMALEAWEMTRRAMMGDAPFHEIDSEELLPNTEVGVDENEKEKDITDMTVEEALAEFYDFIQDRIKNGPPKYLIGSSEFSVEEWDKLLESIDGQLDDMREETEPTEAQIRSLLEERTIANNGAPYNHLAKNGIIEYNGVVFVCDDEHRALCLGDTTDMANCIRIPLSEGGCLIVNRENLGDLANAISMFSPEDVNLIMRAIAQDAKIQQLKKEIEDESSAIDLASEHISDISDIVK